MSPVQKCHHRPFWIVIIVLVLILGLSLLINLAAVGILTESAGSLRDGKGEDEYPDFSETHSYGSGATKVVRIAYRGILTREMSAGWLGSLDPVEDCIRQIRAARQDPKVKAIIFEIDSPGGGVTDADEIYRELQQFKDSNADRKLVALVHDTAASGGYYIAAPADLIIAQPTAIIGSIGVIMQTLNIQNLSEKIGVTDTTIKSGKNKDLLNPFHPVDPEHRALLQTSIDAMHARFVELVAAGRHLKKNKVSELADGRIFTADQALQHGLIDHIGYWEDAVSHTAKLLAVENIFVVSYADKKGFLGNLLGANNPRLPDITSLVPAATTPRGLYLWRP